jgi:hypothetical protein
MAAFTSLDRIVRSVLLQKQFPMHYYLRFLKYGADCIRELSYDTCPTVIPVTLTLNNYFAVDLPCDFLDIARIGIPVGQLVHPISQRDSINNAINYSPTTGLPIPYTNVNSGEIVDPAQFPYYPGYWMFPNINDLGESLGRMYGFPTGYNGISYKFIRERNQIQFNESFPSKTVVLDYIGSGECITNATQVIPYAIKTIEAYIDWQYKLHQRRVNISEEQLAKKEFGAQWRKLRARMDELDLLQIRQILQRSYLSSPKNN